MDTMCDVLVKQCLLCQAAVPQNVSALLKMLKLPQNAWNSVSVNFCTIGNEYALVVIDDYSRYPVVEIVSSTSVNAVIPKLDSIFSVFGIPKVVRSDNGLPFFSDRFRLFTKYLGFKHRKITPVHPESNSKVERFMGVLKNCYTLQNIGSKICMHF